MNKTQTYTNTSNARSHLILIHLFTGSDANPEDVLRNANLAIQEKYEFFETTLQIERFQLDMENCKQCESPAK